MLKILKNKKIFLSAFLLVCLLLANNVLALTDKEELKKLEKALKALHELHEVCQDGGDCCGGGCC